MRTSLCILFFSLACIRLSAQNDSWTYFAAPPGVNSLAARGNTILAGTNGAGIARFDTSGNRTFVNTANSALPSDSITQLAIDAEGAWWMQHPGGISRFDGANQQTWSLAQTGLPANAVIRALKAALDSSLYVATDNGVAIFSDGAWSVLNMSNSGLPSNNIWDVAFGPDGKVYYATTGSGVVVQDGVNWTSYTSANTGVTNLNNVFSVAVTTEGVLWAIGGLNSNALIRLAKLEAGAWTAYTAVSIGIATPAPPLRKVVAGSAGDLLLSTTSTVSILQQGVWAHYNRDEIGCSPGGAIAPAEDGAGRIWVPTSCELAQFNGQAWSRQATGLPGTPGGIMYDGIAEGAEGSIWLGAEFGRYIARLTTADTWEQYFPVDHGASSNDVYSVQADSDGAMWFGLDSARILRYSDGEWTLFDTCATHFPGHFVLTSAGAPNGDRWFSFHRTSSPASSGLARYSADGQWQFFTPANSPMPLAYTRKILIEANGTAWFTTAIGNKGIFRYNGVTWDSITVNNSGLPSNRVSFLAQAPDGAIWAATNAGLARYDGQNWTVLTSTNSGLPSNLVARVAFDQAGGMYVGYAPEMSGTPGARVAVLRGGVWTELIPPNWTNSLQDEPDAFFVDSQNRFWFAKLVDNFGGVYRYDPMLVHTGEPAAEPARFSVSPNPTTGRISLSLQTMRKGDARLQVCNSLGQPVYNRTIPQESAGTSVEVDLSRLPAGVYGVSMFQGGGFSTVRVVKE